MAGKDASSTENPEEVRRLQELQLSRLLPVGFGFRPTAVELVAYYLAGKIDGSLRPVDKYVVPEVDVYGCDPWDLRDKSSFQSGDPMWHFFSPKDRRFSVRQRYSRATQHGQWVFTGKEQEIRESPESPVIGKKRTLIFFERRRDIRSIWAIHEYHTTEDQDDFVLCRLLKKPVEILLQEKNYRHNNMASRVVIV